MEVFIMDFFADPLDDDESFFHVTPTTPMVQISQPREAASDNPLHDPLLENPQAKTEAPPAPTSPPVSLDQVFSDLSIRFNPKELGFLPSDFWKEGEATLGQLCSEFFRRKNNSNCRFPHKLYNALLLSEQNEWLANVVGVEWVDDKTIKVNRERFARLLGIKSIEGSLFNKQGNFPSHGFVELDPIIVKDRFPGFDFLSERLLVHEAGLFVRGCTESEITSCKWSLHTM